MESRMVSIALGGLLGLWFTSASAFLSETSNTVGDLANRQQITDASLLGAQQSQANIAAPSSTDTNLQLAEHYILIDINGTLYRIDLPHFDDVEDLLAELGLG